MAAVLVVGTLDTKEAEYAFAIDQIESLGHTVLLVDVGIRGEPRRTPTISADEIARAADHDLLRLREQGDRGNATLVMAEGATRVAQRLSAENKVDGAFALGGTGGTSIAARVFRELPLGIPKVIVSTTASGQTREYVRESDLILVPSIVDVAGLNRILAQAITGAVGALHGMLETAAYEHQSDKKLIAASMFGVTTDCVTNARVGLDQLGYETLTFHMTGTGGRALEQLVREGVFAGVLDVTTTELADELVGGVFSAGRERLTAAAECGVPQVVSVGALDMVNFGPKETVPERFLHRNLYVHNSSVTLMRTTPEESAVLGERLAQRLNRSTSPATVLLPLEGISAIAVEGGPFYDPDADRALFAAVRENLTNPNVTIVEVEASINDDTFVKACVQSLHRLINAN